MLKNLHNKIFHYLCPEYKLLLWDKNQKYWQSFLYRVLPLSHARNIFIQNVSAFFTYVFVPSVLNVKNSVSEIITNLLAALRLSLTTCEPGHDIYFCKVVDSAAWDTNGYLSVWGRFKRESQLLNFSILPKINISWEKSSMQLIKIN